MNMGVGCSRRTFIEFERLSLLHYGIWFYLGNPVMGSLKKTLGFNSDLEISAQLFT